MKKVAVIYWSQTGNTQAMAEAVGEGIQAAVTNAAGDKCQRCWKVLPTVNAEGLCPRCAQVLQSLV